MYVPPILLPGELPLVAIHHDESTFFANADQDYYWGDYWGDDSITILKQKSLGQSIMVYRRGESADFLQHNGAEAHLLLEAQSEGYFESTRFLIQAIDIF